VFEVISSGRCQRGLELLGPVLVGRGEPPHLVGGQAKLTEHRSERLSTVDRVEELLSHVAGEPRLRPTPAAFSGGIVLRLAASNAATSLIPPRHGAVGYLRAASATLGIGKLADLVQLLQCPGRPWYQTKG
jgi:hypothetical protein